MMAMYQALKNLIMKLTELLMVYEYIAQNAPTAEGEELISLNIKTVEDSSEAIAKIFKNIFGKNIEDIKERTDIVQVFTDFLTAVRYAFNIETQIMQMLKNLYLKTDSSDKNANFSSIIEHQINALKLLALLSSHSK